MMGGADQSSASYAGGRHLEAISLSTKLDAAEKACLHALASQMDYTRPFLNQERYMSVSTLSLRTGYKSTAVKAAIRRLVDKGYLVRRQNKVEGSKELGPTYYRLTAKLFDEYAEGRSLNAQGVGEGTSPDARGGGRETTGGRSPDDHKLPHGSLKELPHSIGGSVIMFGSKGRQKPRHPGITPGERYDGLPGRDPRQPHHREGCKSLETWDIEDCLCGERERLQKRSPVMGSGTGQPPREDAPESVPARGAGRGAPAPT